MCRRREYCSQTGHVWGPRTRTKIEGCEQCKIRPLPTSTEDEYEKEEDSKKYINSIYSFFKVFNSSSTLLAPCGSTNILLRGSRLLCGGSIFGFLSPPRFSGWQASLPTELHEFLCLELVCPQSFLSSCVLSSSRSQA